MTLSATLVAFPAIVMLPGRGCLAIARPGTIVGVWTATRDWQMRARSHPADGIATYALLVGGGVGGVLVSMVALPFALSSPFPTPREGEWIIDNPPFDMHLATAPPVEVPQTGERMDALIVVATPGDPGDQPLTFAERWSLRVPQAATAVPAPAEAVVELPQAAFEAAPATREASLGPAPRPMPPAKAAPAPKHVTINPLERIDGYLWEVYQRKPVKSDSTGDFTWKDQAAAKRLGMSLRAYVIGGMDPDFREQLYHAGHAMDANGLHWSMLSAFRDDYRQGIAAGFKAHGGNSQHGGSNATGGYGYGRAIDITSADGDADAVWHWVDVHGAKFGLRRPMPGIDPAHIQPRNSFHDLAHDLREARLKLENKLNGVAAASSGTKVAAQVDR
jgi:hypothetical protein